MPEDNAKNEKEKRIEREENRRRLDRTLEEIDTMKSELRKWNNQLLDDLDSTRRQLNDVLESGILTPQEFELFSMSKEELFKIARDSDYEYESYIKDLNRRKASQEEAIETIKNKEKSDNKKEKEKDNRGD